MKRRSDKSTVKNLVAEQSVAAFRLQVSDAHARARCDDFWYEEARDIVIRLEELLDKIWSQRGISNHVKKMLADDIRDILGFSAPGDPPRKVFPSRVGEKLERQIDKISVWSSGQPQ